MDKGQFSFRSTADGRVQIFQANRLVTTLKGTQASKFLIRIESCDERGAQQAMARVTGQFKFGNERQAKAKR